MKRILLTLTLLITGLAHAYVIPSRNDLTITNMDNRRYELQGSGAGTTWKFYIKPNETMSQLIPMPESVNQLAIAGKQPVAIGNNKHFAIQNGTLSGAMLSLQK